MSIVDAVPGVDAVVEASHRYFVDSTEADQGVATATGDKTLKDHVDAIGATKKATIYFLHDFDADETDYTLTTNLTVTSNITTEFENGAVLDGVGTLTVNGPFKASQYKVFGSSITVLFGEGNIDNVSVKWFNATGDNTTNDTTALNQAIAACNPSNSTLYLPQGIYRAIPGSLSVIETSIYAPDASIRAHTAADSNLVSVDLWGTDNYKRVVLRALLGYEVSDHTSSGWPDPADRDGTGLYLGTDHLGGTVFEINYIAGFTAGIYLDGATNDKHIASNKFNIQSMIANNYGIICKAGTSYPCEANRFNVEYMLKQDHHVYFQSNPDGAATQRVCSNEVNVVVLETHTDGGEIGFELNGANVYQNDFKVTGAFVWNAGSGNNVICSSSHDNRFQLTGIDFSKTNISAANIFDLHTRAFDFPTSSNYLGRSVIVGSEAPFRSVNNYWRAGDICWNSAPTVAGFLGWVCTTGGTHGAIWSAFGGDVAGIKTLANDATPTVAAGTKFLTGGTTTITDFDDGVTGQIIYIISEHAITITDGTNIFLSGSANFVMAATDTLTLICKADGLWYELGRSDN